MSWRIFFSGMSIIVATIVGSCTHFSTISTSGEGGDRAPAATNSRSLVLIGMIPGEYLQQNKNSYVFGFVEIQNRVIQKMGTVNTAAVDQFIQQQQKATKTVIKLQQEGQQNYDVIYPGLINLHNHTKQNMLPTWAHAKGQFQNRFEWRDWAVYKKSVSQNMNPWIGYGKPIECAAFRWSNLQNMINGAVYLQGPSSCMTGFGILKVEDVGSYLSKKAAIQAPTDLILPDEMTYVWEVLKPKIDSGKTYEQALVEDILDHCPSLKSVVTAENVSKPEGLKILKNQTGLKAACIEGALHEKFIRYVYWVHPTIAGKKEYLKQPNRSAIIAHLAEGRRLDPYNVLEYKLVKLLGLNQPFVNFVHGVGLSKEDFADMKKNNMGLIWSPYSNLLLYGETLDIVAAQKAGVNIAIGSDWVPTGSKSVLEEIKLAVRYVEREKIQNIFTDEVLYKMMTANAAQMINHWDISSSEAGIGRLAQGAAASILVTSMMDQNPYSNLVRQVTEKDVNLVLVNGGILYGNVPYLEQAGVPSGQYEIFSDEIIEADRTLSTSTVPKPDATIKAANADGVEEAGSSDKTSPGQISPYLISFSTATKQMRFNEKDFCQFSAPKAIVTPNTKKIEPTIEAFLRMTRIDLDKVSDIRQLLAAASLSQSLNRLTPTGDNPKFATSYFPPLYSCNDPRHIGRLSNYVKSDGKDELRKNLSQRAANRKVKGMPSSAKKLAESYRQSYVEK